MERGGIYMETKEIEMHVKAYFEDCRLRRRLNDKTLKAYRIDLKQYFDYMETELENHKKIIEYIHYLNQKYPKYKTVKRKIASVKAFYSYLEYEEIIETTPFKKIRSQIKEPQLLPKTISSATLNSIFECLLHDIENAQTIYQKKLAIRNATVIELLFSTGIRISELCNLKKEDIDIEGRTIKIFGKGSKERILYIGNDEVIQLLQEYESLNREVIDETGQFFINKFNSRLSDQSVRFLIHRLEKRVGSSVHLTPHMFRHTFATLLLEKDVDIRYIQKILGHSSIAVTQIYTHVSYSKQKEILELKNPINDYHLKEINRNQSNKI